MSEGVRHCEIETAARTKDPMKSARKDDMDQRQALPSYVLITPARNEEKFIEKTIESVIRQTVLPLKWVIVNDGSMDATGSIVGRYLAKYAWIELVNLPVRKNRDFAAKDLQIDSSFIAPRATLEAIAADQSRADALLVPWQRELLRISENRSQKAEVS